MKPLNLDNRPCSPISSNCVIWQGPDIPCIKLCTGDTVSDIVFKLGTELCTIMDQLKVSNYDLTCLGISACPPEDFQALIQLLINKICEINGITPTDEKSSGCPDCVVSVAPCFVEGTQTTMQLIDYVQMIANKICSILSEIDVINNQITNLDNRVTVLENTPPPTFTIPSIDTGCLATYITGNPASAAIDIVLDTLVNNGVAGYCALIAATDLPANILSAVATQCIASTDDSLANPGDTFSSAYGPYTGFGTWNNTPFTAADAINNLWIAVCDMYNYLSNQNAGPSLTIEEPCACGEAIANDADIYVHIDISSGPYAEDTCPGSFLANKEVLCTAVYNWYTNYQTANPSYTGNLYIFEISLPETYLKFPRIIKNGNLSAITTPFGFNWLNPLTATTVGAVVPPNWNTPSWAPPTSIVFISFVNEANSGSIAAQTYHGQNNPPSLTLNQLQPTSGWTTDHAEFVFDYNNHWDFFRGVIYPANSFDNTSRNFLLHAYAATTNGPITSSGLSTALGSNFDATFSGMTYPISNVYVTANKGLWNYNWTPVLNKTTTGGGCIIEFTEEEFATDLDNILGSGPCDCASLINSWNPTTQTLALRSITSCSLDISVTESGCIAIESTGGGSTTEVIGSDWIDVTSSTAGSVTTYEVTEIAKPGLSVFQSPPASLNNTAPGLNTGRLCDGSIQVMSGIEYNDFGAAYNPATGIFTVPVDGVYQIDFFAHFSRDVDNGWFDAAVPGMITAGIVSPTGCNFYCINNNSPVVVQKHSSINGSFTRRLTNGTQICLKVINLTNFDYIPETGDIVRFSVQRVN